MAECHLKQLHVCVRACVFKCVCVKERHRHKERIKGLTGRKKYIVGKRRKSVWRAAVSLHHTTDVLIVS